MAAASDQSGFYGLFLNSGRMNHVLPPPGVGGGFLAEHFEEENKLYAAWLARARTSLDQLLRDALQNGLPILPFPAAPAPRGKKPKMREVLEQIDGATARPDRRFRLSLRVSQKLTDEQREWLRRGVAGVLEKHAP
jgi:hypothetical protein